MHIETTGLFTIRATTRLRLQIKVLIQAGLNEWMNE